MSFTGKRLISAAPTGGLEGEVILQSGTHPNTGNWTVPEGVYSISVLTVDAGFNGGNGWPGDATYPGNGGVGGARGHVFYRNNMPVVPGEVIAYRIGAADTNATTRRSMLGSVSVRPPDFEAISDIPGVSSAEPGGTGSTTTYESGYGGRATSGVSVTNPMGVPLTLQGTRNPGTTTGSGKGADGRDAPSDYGGGGGGGGGGARLDGALGGVGGKGRRGCIRIVWPGESRQFPYDAA